MNSMQAALVGHNLGEIRQEIKVSVLFHKQSGQYFAVDALYISRCVRPQFNSERAGSFYHEIKIREYYFRDNNQKCCTDTMQMLYRPPSPHASGWRTEEDSVFSHQERCSDCHSSGGRGTLVYNERRQPQQEFRLKSPASRTLPLPWDGVTPLWMSPGCRQHPLPPLAMPLVSPMAVVSSPCPFMTLVCLLDLSMATI